MTSRKPAHLLLVDDDPGLLKLLGMRLVSEGYSVVTAESGLEGNIQTYSLRHTMARWMRMRSVPAWEAVMSLVVRSRMVMLPARSRLPIPRMTAALG